MSGGGREVGGMGDPDFVNVVATGQYRSSYSFYADSTRFRRQVVPGDVLDLHVELVRLSGRAGKGAGRALVNGELACQCELLFVVVDG